MQASDALHLARTSPWIPRLARVGLASKGIVYITVGVLALQVAAGDRGQAPNSERAVEALSRQPLGTALLAIIVAGLAGYVAWRFLQAFADAEGKGRSAKGLVARAGYAASGIIYGGLAAFAFALLTDRPQDGGGGSEAAWTARILAAPLGKWWVFLIAAAILAYAGVEAWRAWSGEFRKHLHRSEMSGVESRWADGTGRAGLAARAAVLTVIGAFLLSAAANRDPGQARGLDGALAELARRQHGELLLGLVALGLACYGAYQLVEARYRRIRT
jgi:hypothetical protein